MCKKPIHADYSSLKKLNQVTKLLNLKVGKSELPSIRILLANVTPIIGQKKYL